MAMREWIYNRTETDEKNLIKRLLSIRGLKTEEEMREFLNPLEFTPYSPDVFTDMSKAVEKLSHAVDNKEKIVIYGDFDADGITSTSLLYRTFTMLGADVSYFIPDREKEGHGLDTKALVKLMTTLKPKVIITVDCGISNVEEVNFINSFKIDVIITDHHEAPEELPKAYAIINPKAPYVLNENLSTKDIRSLTSLAGVGVAFKVATALLQHYEKTDFISSILPYAAVGTVADVVPLVGENRYIVAKGLNLISQGKHYGLKRLIERAGVNTETGINTETIAFTVAPRLNASGRLDTVEQAIKLLISDNPQEIEMAITNLEEFNKIRQNLSQEIFAEADEMIKKDGNRNPAIILFNSKWHVGIIGIVASKIVEKYYKPTFLMTYSEETKQIKCSARSIPGVHLYEVISQIGEFLDTFGGHSLAAGLAFSPEKVPFKQIKESLIQIIKEVTAGKELKPHLDIDMELTPDDITVDFTEEISRLEPFGEANPSPVFALKDLKIKQKKLMGENKNHLKLTVQKDNSEFNCIRWQQGDIGLVEGDTIDVAFHPQINEFNGNISIQLIVDDIHSEYLQEEETEHNSHFKIYDHRKKTDILPQVNDYIRKTKQKVMVFAENRQTLEMLKPFKDISARIFTRENIPQCNSVMFFDYPADKETFKTIIKDSSPQSIHLMNYDIKYFDEKEFLKTFSGMLKFACNNNNGHVNLLRCASFLGKSINLIKNLLELFEECGFIQIKEKALSEYVINFKSIDNPAKVLHNPKYENILNLAEECELFQKSLLEDDINEIDNLCNIV